MIKKENDKFVLFAKDGKKKLGTFDTEDEAKEREAEINRLKHAKGALVEVSLAITKASLHEDGTMRWLGTCSDTGMDRTGEATSLSLFNDWIDRVETGKSVSFLPPPRQPFLGLSHYPSLGGYGEAGDTDKMLIDGAQFKAGGSFHKEEEHPIGKALFQSIRTERDLVKKGSSVETPIRISAGWWDLAHKHGDFIFERKSLLDICPMCKSGSVDKIYLKGQLDHFAATRVPINPRTSLALEEKAMTTRKEDALSIIDDEELIDDLDKRAGLTSKAKTEELPEGMVTKGDETQAPDTDKAEAEIEAKLDLPLGGAMSIKDADANRDAHKQAGELQSQSQWALLQMVMGNILQQSEPAEIKGRVQNLFTEFATRVEAIKAAVEDVVMLENGGKIMSEETKIKAGPIDINEAVNAALTNPEMNRQAAVESIQKSFETFAESVNVQLDTAFPPDAGEAVAKAMTPVVEKLELLISKLDAGTQAQAVQPIQKSLSPIGMPVQQVPKGDAISPITGQPSKIRQAVEHSMRINQ